MMLRRILASLLVCSHLASSMAWAQGDPKAAAHEHYEKALAAFDDERFQDAADEFETAYRISPAFAVLYNLGRVYVALGRPVEAVQAFEKYLAQGGTAVAPGRAQEVRAEIERQRARVGTLTVRTVPAAAEVRLDGRLVGKTPLAQPVLVSAGKHTVEALLSGYVPALRELNVAGLAQIEIDLRLDPVVVAESATRVGNAPPTQSAVASGSAPSAPPTADSTPPAAGARVVEGGSISNGMRSWGYLVAAVGLLGGATGGVIALIGVRDGNDALNRASNATAPNPTAMAQYAQASRDFQADKSETELGWMLAGVGAGVLLGGALLVAISPDRKMTAGVRAVAPWIAANGGGVGMVGVW
jgi:tetratricopeptide (TPR) repeat protein